MGDITVVLGGGTALGVVDVSLRLDPPPLVCLALALLRKLLRCVHMRKNLVLTSGRRVCVSIQ